MTVALTVARILNRPNRFLAPQLIDITKIWSDAPLMGKINPKQRCTVPSGSLSEWMEHLSPRRRELIQKVLQEPRAYVLLSLRAASERLDTDSATFVRTVKRMGFESYRAFQTYLQDLSIVNATSVDRMQSIEPIDERDASLETYLRAATEQDVRNLMAVRVSLDAGRLEALAKRIHQSRHRLLIGGDAAESMVHYLRYRFATIGIPFVTSTSAGDSFHVARTMQKTDLVIAISFRKGLRMTVDGMKRAKENGAYCVGLTGTHLSPIARLADEFFVTSVDSGSFMDSYVAPIALANQILSATASYQRSLSLESLKEVAEEQRSGYRWYEAT